MVGYSPEEVERLTHNIDVAMAKIEDLADGILAVAPDHGLRVDVELEALREKATAVKEIIERRREP